MIDLGDPVVLTFNVVDSAGNPVDLGGAAVLTITLPDATVATPAVTHAGIGVYTVSYPTVQAGRHGVRWVGSGTNAQTYTDVFNVEPASAGLLISLADARDAIGTPFAATAKDEQLRAAIVGATPIIEDLCGPIIPRTCDEWHDGGTRVVRLLYPPLISVTSVTESWGVFTRTLTAQPLDAGSFDAYGYTVDLVDGYVQRRVMGSAAVFPAGRRNVHVVYVAGRSIVRENIYRASRRLIRHLWQQEQQGFRPELGGAPEQMTTTPSGYAVPRAVVEILADEVRTIGLA